MYFSLDETLPDISSVANWGKGALQFHHACMVSDIDDILCDLVDTALRAGMTGERVGGLAKRLDDCRELLAEINEHLAKFEAEPAA